MDWFYDLKGTTQIHHYNTVCEAKSTLPFLLFLIPGLTASCSISGLSILAQSQDTTSPCTTAETSRHSHWERDWSPEGGRGGARALKPSPAHCTLPAIRAGVSAELTLLPGALTLRCETSDRQELQSPGKDLVFIYLRLFI